MKNRSVLSAYLQNVFLITWHIYIALNAFFLIVMGGFDWYLTETFAIEEYIPFLLFLQPLFIPFSIVFALVFGMFISILHRNTSQIVKFEYRDEFEENLIDYIELNLPYVLAKESEYDLVFKPTWYYLQMSSLQINVRVKYEEAILYGPYDHVKMIESRFV